MKRQPVRGANGRFLSTEEAAKMRGEAVQLRASGLSYARIAQRLGVSKSTVWETIQTAYAQVALDSAPVALHLELERLDEDLTTLSTIKAKLLKSLRAQDEGGDGPDIIAVSNTLVKLTEARGRIGERHARLRGLDAPTTVRVETTEGVPVSEVLARVAAAVRPYPDAAAAVALVALELAGSLPGAEGEES
ncbi:helix-turn-helix domain-containing protein [Streptomyces sp. NPDC007264]|uniref:helix-turn-helix domain-containing protein n=1 Tax=Streptomyces sp. NPDC007264 TaxID=3364777 RepID=UPI0036D7FDA9